jgi:hypothetical protein
MTDNLDELICEVCDEPTGREYAICLKCEAELRAALADNTVARVLRKADDNAD